MIHPASAKHSERSDAKGAHREEHRPCLSPLGPPMNCSFLIFPKSIPRRSPKRRKAGVPGIAQLPNRLLPFFRITVHEGPFAQLSNGRITINDSPKLVYTGKSQSRMEKPHE